jgi:hypothetical protein
MDNIGFQGFIGTTRSIPKKIVLSHYSSIIYMVLFLYVVPFHVLIFYYNIYFLFKLIIFFILNFTLNLGK